MIPPVGPKLGRLTSLEAFGGQQLCSSSGLNVLLYYILHSTLTSQIRGWHAGSEQPTELLRRWPCHPCRSSTIPVWEGQSTTI